MPKHFYQIVAGCVSGGGAVIKPGDVVEWTEEQAASWYPQQKGWIIRIPAPEQPAQTIKPAPAGEDPAERAPYEPVTEPEGIEEHAKTEPEMEPAETEPEPERGTREPETEPETKKVTPRGSNKRRR